LRVRIIRYEYIEVKKSVREHIAKCDAGKLCYACSQPLDPNEKNVRHVHEKCRSAQRRLIAASIETVKSLVEKGELAEKQDGGRKPSNPVTKRARGLLN